MRAKLLPSKKQKTHGTPARTRRGHAAAARLAAGRGRLGTPWELPRALMSRSPSASGSAEAWRGTVPAGAPARPRRPGARPGPPPSTQPSAPRAAPGSRPARAAARPRGTRPHRLRPATRPPTAPARRAAFSSWAPLCGLQHGKRPVQHARRAHRPAGRARTLPATRLHMINAKE